MIGFGFHFTPSVQKTVPSRDIRVVGSIREVQLPVNVFDVFDQADRRLFKIGERDVGADARDHHALVNLWDILQRRPPTDGAGDACEPRSATRPQGLTVINFDPWNAGVLRRAGVVRELRLKQPTVSQIFIDVLIQHIVLQRQLSAIAKDLREPRTKVPGIVPLLFSGGKATQPHGISNLFAAAVEDIRGELRVEFGQRGFDAVLAE